MGLSNQQFEAINYLFDDRFPEFEVAERLGISERTLRRWRQNPEFKAMLDGARTELFHRNRERLLASNQGRIDNKFERHRILTERLHLENKIAAANSHIVTIFNRDLTERNIARCKQLVDTIQAQRLKDHPAPIPPDKFGQLTELDNKILSGEF